MSAEEAQNLLNRALGGVTCPWCEHEEDKCLALDSAQVESVARSYLALRSALSDLLEAAERVGGADRAEVVVGPYPDLASALDDLVRASVAARSVLGENR